MSKIERAERIKTPFWFDERNRTIKALYDSGVSVADIAQRYSLSAAHVWTLVGRG